MYTRGQCVYWSCACRLCIGCMRVYYCHRLLPVYFLIRISQLLSVFVYWLCVCCLRICQLCLLIVHLAPVRMYVCMSVDFDCWFHIYSLSHKATDSTLLVVHTPSVCVSAGVTNTYFICGVSGDLTVCLLRVHLQVACLYFCCLSMSSGVQLLKVPTKFYTC